VGVGVCICDTHTCLFMDIGLFSAILGSFQLFRVLFIFMGLLSGTWVSFLTYTGLFSHVQVSFHMYFFFSIYIGLCSCTWVSFPYIWFTFHIYRFFSYIQVSAHLCRSLFI